MADDATSSSTSTTGRRGARARAGPRRRQVAEQGREGAPATSRCSSTSCGTCSGSGGPAQCRPRPRRGGDPRPVDGRGLPAVTGHRLARAALRGVVRHARHAPHGRCRSWARCAWRCRPRSPSGRTSRCTCRRAGSTTGPVPSNVGLFDVEADLLAPRGRRPHRRRRGRAGAAARRVRSPSSGPSSSARCAKLGIDVELSPKPQEVPDPIPFPDDTTHTRRTTRRRPRASGACSRSSSRCSRAYRADYQGKVSRVQFFWGSADLALTRFSGEPCPPPGVPGCSIVRRTTTSR